MAIGPIADAGATGYVQTTNAVATDVPGTTFVTGNKQVESYAIEVWAVRTATAGPVVGYWRIDAMARISPSGGITELPTAGGGAGSNPNKITKAFSDAGMDVNVVLSGTTGIKVQVTGLATTTIDWYVRIKQTIWNSS